MTGLVSLNHTHSHWDYHHNKAIVVTGSAGFIGSNIVKRLNELGEGSIFTHQLHKKMQKGINKTL